jgi:membrane-associated phospholipid phosphatase
LNSDSSHKFARFISTVFVPPSFTLLTFTYYAFYLENDYKKILATIIIALFFGFIFPIVLFVVLKKRGKIVDVDASVKEERTLPYSIATLFYLIGLLLMIGYQLNIITISFGFCYISNTLITIIINHYWKISAHAMGASGTFSALFFVIGFWAFLFFPIVLIVGWSRVKLNCHTLYQVFAGIILTCFSTLLQMYLIIHYFG